MRLFGMCKGAGMIHPNMATMLAIIVTDAAIERPLLAELLSQAVDVSFNCISVDGDMSTNDTVLLLANGAVGLEARSWKLKTVPQPQPRLSLCLSLNLALHRPGPADRPRRRGRDEVHHDPGRRRGVRCGCEDGSQGGRQLAAGEDRVLRRRRQLGAYPGRGRVFRRALVEPAKADLWIASG